LHGLSCYPLAVLSVLSTLCGLTLGLSRLILIGHGFILPVTVHGTSSSAGSSGLVITRGRVLTYLAKGLVSSHLRPWCSTRWAGIVWSPVVGKTVEMHP